MAGCGGKGLRNGGGGPGWRLERVAVDHVWAGGDGPVDTYGGGSAGGDAKVGRVGAKSGLASPFRLGDLDSLSGRAFLLILVAGIARLTSTVRMIAP